MTFALSKMFKPWPDDLPTIGHVHSDFELNAVQVSGNLTFNGTKVNKFAHAGRSIVATGAELNDLGAYGSITLTDTVVKGKVASAGYLFVQHGLLDKSYCENEVLMNKSVSKGRVRGFASINAVRSDLQGNVIAETDIRLFHCTAGKSLATKGAVSIEQSTVDGNVFCGSVARIEDSELMGTLKTKSGDFTVSNGKLRDIVVENVKKAAKPVLAKWFDLLKPKKKEEIITPIHRPTIVLDKKTIVHGQITFEGEEGVVILRGGAQLWGRVFGGRLISEPESEPDPVGP